MSPTDMRDQPPTPLTIELDRAPGVVTLRLGGELDVQTAPRLRSYLSGLARSHHGRLVIELRGLTFVDSSGLNALLAANRYAERDGWTLEIVRGERHVQRVVELVGPGEALPFVDPPEAPAPG